MTMTGDGESQPIEGADPLDDLADALDPKAEKEQRAASESEDESEEEEQEAEGEDESEDAEDGDDDEADDEQDEATFTIKVNGKEINVKQSELIELGQKGADYTAKTMGLAEDRRAVEAEHIAIKEVRQQADQAFQETQRRLEAFTAYMESHLGAPPSVDLLSTDATTYLIQKEQYEARKGQLGQAYAALESNRQEEARQRQASIMERGQATEKVLRDTLPGWNDNTLEELAGYAGKVGLTPQTAAEAMLEPGFWQLAQKAKAYDAIQEAKSKMKPKETLAKVAKPSAQNQTGKVAERAKREAAFNKNPSVDALADLLR